MARLEKVTVIEKKTGRRVNVNLCDLDKFEAVGYSIAGEKKEKPKERPPKKKAPVKVESPAMTIRDLKRKAKLLGIENYKNMSMDELIAAIKKTEK